MIKTQWLKKEKKKMGSKMGKTRLGKKKYCAVADMKYNANVGHLLLEEHTNVIETNIVTARRGGRKGIE
jgi:hypothetical protein